MKIPSTVVVFCSVLCSLFVSSSVHAKTFVGVLWPMFGPMPAIGLVELVAELKTMPDVEVSTYLHQSWPSLVNDIERQPKGTRTIVIGYSLGANSSVFVANKARYVDLIIALQPSMLSWNPAVTGQVGRMIEIYNPNPWMTFGGMGSKKLVGPNIEYIENNDSHPGAQFSAQFRSLVKTEVAKLSTGGGVEIAKAEMRKPPEVPKAPPLPEVRKPVEVAQQASQPALAKQTKPVEVAQQVGQPAPTKQPKREPDAVKQPKNPPGEALAFLDALSRSVDSGSITVAASGSLPAGRKLTASDMIDYAKRTYRVSRQVDERGGARRLSGSRTADAESVRESSL